MCLGPPLPLARNGVAKPAVPIGIQMTPIASPHLLINMPPEGVAPTNRVRWAVGEGTGQVACQFPHLLAHILREARNPPSELLT